MNLFIKINFFKKRVIETAFIDFYGGEEYNIYCVIVFNCLQK